MTYFYKHMRASALALQAFSERAGAPKGTVEADDLTMAIQAHATFAFVQPPPQDVRFWSCIRICWRLDSSEPCQRALDTLSWPLARRSTRFCVAARCRAPRCDAQIATIVTMNTTALMGSHAEPTLTHAVQVLASLARRRNQRPLPEVARKHGLRLPPDADCLTQPGYAPVVPSAGAQLHAAHRRTGAAVGRKRCCVTQLISRRPFLASRECDRSVLSCLG